MSATYTGRAWSCTIRLVVADKLILAEAADDLHAVLDRVGQAASRFDPNSALSRANERPGRPAPIPPLLVELITAALTAAARTDGAVDPTVGAAMNQIGYDRDISLVESDGPALEHRSPSVTWRDVRLDRTAGLLTVPAHTTLDLGATAKAFTADLAARTLSRRYSTTVLVELGGDIAVAGAPSAGWPIRVAEREGESGQIVLLRSGGLTTSTTTIRRWRRGDRVVHHIVDPRTGAPAAGPWRTASVYAATALDANTASTAAIVLGYEALPWLTKRGYAARLVGADGRVVHTPGWPTDSEAMTPRRAVGVTS